MLWKIISTVFVIHLCVYTKGVPEKSTQRNKFVKVAHNIKNIQRTYKKSFEPSYERPNRSRKIGVFVTSFNTNANIPEGNDLKLWLNLEKKKDEELDGIMPDLVVIGLQEIVKLNPGNATRDAFQAMTNIQSPKVSKWINTLSEELNQYHYACKGFVPMFGLLLVLYHRRKQLDSSRASPSNEDDTISLTKMRTAKVQTGLGKQVQTAMRNKGAVAISLLLNNSVWVCFVNAHLSHGAGPDNLRERNRDYFTIIKEMNFATKGHPPFTILQHDVVFWVGDLNYRLSYEGSGLNREQTIAWSKGSLKELLLLLPYDELRKQIQVDETISTKNGHATPAFGVFHEADINYAPTYKHDKNTSDDNYDTSKKQRWPAWTDRILYWISDTFVSNQSENISSEKDLELEQTCYESVPKIKVSDHKPVRAVFRITSATAKSREMSMPQKQQAQVQEKSILMKEIAVGA
ncbi:polyphosphatidylinositol phosphatase INP52 [Ditylenchus destructor]|nr:polyphosphatidylinositol phosphatase INP52 [Ditylenchus destructor]